ncbi:type II secretion system secretin GspD [Salinisphaera sp. RV14]|uniref:type II secretion system secretin GspD n=1 Tax=Salinisphaera sp. RV14 TaxID=3454140 RepID=UPI003F850203
MTTQLARPFLTHVLALLCPLALLLGGCSITTPMHIPKPVQPKQSQAKTGSEQLRAGNQEKPQTKVQATPQVPSAAYAGSGASPRAQLRNMLQHGPGQSGAQTPQQPSQGQGQSQGKNQNQNNNAGSQTHQVTKIPAQGGQPARYKISFDQMPLPGFIQYVLGDLLNFNLYVAPRVAQDKNKVVTLRADHPVTRAQLIATTRTVLNSFGLALVQDGQLYRVMPSKDVKNVAPKYLRNQNEASTPTDLRPVFHYIKLQNADFQNVYQTLNSLLKGQQVQIYPQRSQNSLILYGQRADVQNALDAVHLLDQPRMQGTQGRMISLAYLQPKTLADKLGKVLSSEGYAVGGESSQGNGPGAISLIPVPSSGSIILLSPNHKLLQHAVAWVHKLDSPGQRSGNKGLYVYRVKNANATALARTVSQFFGGSGGSGSGNQGSPGGLTLSGTAGTETTSGGTGGMSNGPGGNNSNGGFNNGNNNNGNGNNGNGNRNNNGGSQPRVFGKDIVVNVPTNSIIFRGSAQDFQQLRSLLQELDQPERQVLIEVTIAEVDLNNTQQTGISWALGAADIGNAVLKGGTLGGLSVPANSGINFSVLNNSGATRALIEALATNSHARILSTPRIMALNGHQAFINVGNSVPVLTSQQTSNTQINGSSSILQSIQYVDTGVILSVTPVIHGQGDVDMQVKQEVSNANSTNTGVSNSPTIQKRTVQTDLSAPNGDTVVLGGLIKRNQSTSNSGVPLLKDLPGIGALFRTRNQSDDRTELLVLLTPHILSHASGLQSVTQALRNRFPGLSQ